MVPYIKAYYCLATAPDNSVGGHCALSGVGQLLFLVLPKIASVCNHALKLPA